MSTDLTVRQRNLLRWLAREEATQYGECHGPDLEALHTEGFVRVFSSGQLNSRVDVWPPPTLRHAVSVTDAGYEYIREQGMDVWQYEPDLGASR